MIRHMQTQCPHCGRLHTVTLDDALPDISQLSPVAFAILTKAPVMFKKGRTYSVRQLGDLLGYSHQQIHVGLRQLRARGYVAEYPYGDKGRVRYHGVPARMFGPEAKALIDAA